MAIRNEFFEDLKHIEDTPISTSRAAQELGTQLAPLKNCGHRKREQDRLYN